jgi:hypothetical protein
LVFDEKEEAEKEARDCQDGFVVEIDSRTLFFSLTNRAKAPFLIAGTTFL